MLYFSNVGNICYKVCLYFGYNITAKTYKKYWRGISRKYTKYENKHLLIVLRYCKYLQDSCCVPGTLLQALQD